MKCLVCRGDLLDEEALSCSACREFAVGARLHAGHAPPASWKATQIEYSNFLLRLDELAQQYKVPVPLDASDVAGAWAHFVLALQAYFAADFRSAQAEARQALMRPAPRGWKGFHNHARVVEAASVQA